MKHSELFSYLLGRVEFVEVDGDEPLDVVAMGGLDRAEELGERGLDLLVRHLLQTQVDCLNSDNELCVRNHRCTGLKVTFRSFLL